MKFRYKKIAPKFIRPVISIQVAVGDIVIPYEMLVDSGADYCYLDAEFGELLGIDIERGKKDSVVGIGGTVQTCFVHRVRFIIGGHSHETEVRFVRDFARCGHGLLGQRGFFDTYVVKFDFLKDEMEIFERVANKRREKRS